MRAFLEKHLPFLGSHDHFFIVETFGVVMRVSLAVVYPETKEVRILKMVIRDIQATPSASFIEALPAIAKQFHLPVGARVLALLDHHRATILSGTISLMRSDPRAEIKQAELENLISQGLWKLSTAHRREAARKMEVPEVRVRLADADVVQVRLNGHRVVNPIGFMARSVELCFRETFVDEVLLERFAVALTEDNLSGVFESPVVLAGLVARLYPQEEFLFVSVGVRESVIYRVNQSVISHLDSFQWGVQTLMFGAAGQFGVDQKTIARMFASYARNEVSPALRKAIQSAASGELAILSNGIAAHQPRSYTVQNSQKKDLPVYVHAAIPLPDFLFDEAFTRRLGLSLKLTAVNERFIGERTGFVVHLGRPEISASQYTFDALLAVLADIYAAQAAPMMSRAAKQRARWARSGG